MPRPAAVHVRHIKEMNMAEHQSSREGSARQPRSILGQGSSGQGSCPRRYEKFYSPYGAMSGCRTGSVQCSAVPYRACTVTSTRASNRRSRQINTMAPSPLTSNHTALYIRIHTLLTRCIQRCSATSVSLVEPRSPESAIDRYRPFVSVVQPGSPSPPIHGLQAVYVGTGLR